MSKKHYDNKTDILRQMKENRIRADIAAASAFSANMLMNLYVLRDRFGFGQERAERFANGMLQLTRILMMARSPWTRLSGEYMRIWGW